MGTMGMPTPVSCVPARTIATVHQPRYHRPIFFFPLFCNWKMHNSRLQLQQLHPLARALSAPSTSRYACSPAGFLCQLVIATTKALHCSFLDCSGMPFLSQTKPGMPRLLRHFACIRCPPGVAVGPIAFGFSLDHVPFKGKRACPL